jgi:hypothetical protein
LFNSNAIQLNNKDLLVLNSDFDILSLVPDIIDGFNTISSKCLPQANINANILPNILDGIKTIKTVTLPVVDISVNVVHNAKMQYLAENYLHIINMESIALKILYAKTNGIEFMPTYLYGVKGIGCILNNTYLPTLGSTLSSPLNYHWGIYIPHNFLICLYKYMFLFVPLVIPFIGNIVGLIFNILGNSKYPLLYLLNYLLNIINNCFLYMLYMLEFCFFIISMLSQLGLRLYAIYIY